MSHFCEICNKSYASNQSLWTHKKNKHNNIEQKNIIKTNKKIDTYKCKHCSKEFSQYQNRWRHEQKCEKKSNLHKTIEEMKKEIDKLKSNQSIDKPICDSNNKFCKFLSKPGIEDLSGISEKDIEQILNQKIYGVIALIEKLNFNPNCFNNHTFCTTALNDKHINTINCETLEIEKQRKKDFFDMLLWTGINKLKILYEKVKLKSAIKSMEYKNNIDYLVEYILDDKKKKELVELLNALTFNNKKLVLNTWLQLKNNEIPTSLNVDSHIIDDKILNGIKNESLMNINLLSNDSNHYRIKNKIKKSNEKEIII